MLWAIFDLNSENSRTSENLFSYQWVHCTRIFFVKSHPCELVTHIVAQFLRKPHQTLTEASIRLLSIQTQGHFWCGWIHFKNNIQRSVPSIQVIWTGNKSWPLSFWIFEFISWFLLLLSIENQVNISKIQNFKSTLISLSRSLTWI